MEYLANRKEREKPLSHFLEHGIKVTPLNNTKNPLLKWSNSESFSGDPKVVKDWYENGIEEFPGLGPVRAFATQPALSGGFIAVDLDVKKEKDGIHAFKALVWEREVILRYGLKDWPAVTLTPSGGLHLWFRYSGPQVKKVDYKNGVEIIHSKALVTVPGSESEAGKYRFFGDLSKAPRFPAELLPKEKPVRRYDGPLENRGKYSFDQLFGFTVEDIESYPGPGVNNDFIMFFAIKARGERYSAEETIEYLRRVLSPADGQESYDQIPNKVWGIFNGR